MFRLSEAENREHESCKWYISGNDEDQLKVRLVCSHWHRGADGEMHKCHPPHYGHSVVWESSVWNQKLKQMTPVREPLSIKMQEYIYETYKLEAQMWKISPMYDPPLQFCLPVDCELVCLICGVLKWDPMNRTAFAYHARWCGKLRLPSETANNEIFPLPKRVYTLRFFEYLKADALRRVELRTKWQLEFLPYAPARRLSGRKLVADMSDHEHDQVKASDRVRKQKYRDAKKLLKLKERAEEREAARMVEELRVLEAKRDELLSLAKVAVKEEEEGADDFIDEPVVEKLKVPPKRKSRAKKSRGNADSVELRSRLNGRDLWRSVQQLREACDMSVSIPDEVIIVGDSP